LAGVRCLAVRAIRTVGVGAAAACIAGVVVGFVARVLMRTVTLSTGAEREFTIGGTLAIIFIYVVAMIPGAVVAAYTTRWWRWIGVAAGSVFLIFPAIGVASEEIGSTEGLSKWRWILLILTSALVFATIAVVPIVAVRLVDRFLVSRRRFLAVRH
jgi:general stress protein CsbA